MTYALPLAERQRYARNKRNQYWRDPEYRLRQINSVRAREGKPLFADIAEVPTRGPRAV